MWSWQLLLVLQWNLSFGTPLFKRHFHLLAGDIKFGPRKVCTFASATSMGLFFWVRRPCKGVTVYCDTFVLKTWLTKKGLLLLDVLHLWKFNKQYCREIQSLIFLKNIKIRMLFFSCPGWIIFLSILGWKYSWYKNYTLWYFRLRMHWRLNHQCSCR